MGKHFRITPYINYAFCVINNASALLSSKTMVNSSEYCIYTSVMNTYCVSKKGFQFFSFFIFSTPLFPFFPLSFTYHSLQCPPVSFFLFFLGSRRDLNQRFPVAPAYTCLSAIPLDHDDLLRFPGQKIDIFLRAQVQIYITKELKCVFM